MSVGIKWATRNASKWHVVARPEGHKQRSTCPAHHTLVLQGLRICNHNSVPKFGRPTPTEIFQAIKLMEMEQYVLNRFRCCELHATFKIWINEAFCAFIKAVTRVHSLEGKPKPYNCEEVGCYTECHSSSSMSRKYQCKILYLYWMQQLRI